MPPYPDAKPQTATDAAKLFRANGPALGCSWKDFAEYGFSTFLLITNMSDEGTGREDLH